MGQLTFIVGGARSGKSSLALKTGMLLPEPRVFLATAEPFDKEMKNRISKHKKERGNSFITIEESFNINGVILKLKKEQQVKTVLIDCLTVWLGNLFHYLNSDQNKIKSQILELVKVIDSCPFNLIFVANEVGQGIVPDSAMSRDFRDLAGWLNQAIAAKADKVYLCVCGIPVSIK